MSNEQLQEMPVNTIVIRTNSRGRKSEWIKTQDGREPHWAWFRRVLKDGTITAIEGLLLASEVEVR